MILLMDKGRIVGQGTHEELLETSTLYAEIVYSQLERDSAVSDQLPVFAMEG